MNNPARATIIINLNYINGSENCGMAIGEQHIIRHGIHCPLSEPFQVILPPSELKYKVYWQRVFGFQFTYKTGCGDFLTGQSQISSPGYPSSYPNDAHCLWRVKTRVNTVAVVQFENTFNIADSGNCSNDYVKLQNGFYDAPPLLTNTSNEGQNNANGHYCGNSPPAILETSTNQLSIGFMSNETGTAQGFSIRVTEKESGCGGNIRLTHNSPSVDITSPGYPALVGHERECIWVISGPVLQRIRVNFITFDMWWRGCDLNYLVFHDGGTPISPVIGGKMCDRDGRRPPPILVSSGHNLRIRYVTSVPIYVHGTKFKVQVSLALCGGQLTATSGEVTSPNYPHNYGSNQDCEWYITVPDNHYISFTTVFFDLELSVNCSADYVEIRDTNSAGERLGRDCGSGDMFNGTAVSSLGNTAYIRFHSNNMTVGSGFKIRFHESTTVCGGDLTTQSGEIESPNYPQHFVNLMRCKWNIIVAEGHSITLTLDSPCTGWTWHDNSIFEIYNGIIPGSPKYSTSFCDSLYRRLGIESYPIRSSGNTMSVMANIEHQWSFAHGFKFSYHSSEEAVCGGVINSQSGNITNPDNPILANGRIIGEVNVHCIWRIHNSNPTNSTIVLRFTRLDLLSNCNRNFVGLREGPDHNSPVIGRYCRHRIPRELIYTPYANIFIRYLLKVHQLHYRAGSAGFALQYSIQACGGILTQPGSITSPNYPNNSSQITACMWKVIAPEGSAIKIHFTNFSVGSALNSSQSCNTSFLQFYMGGLPDSPRTRKFCGQMIPDDMTVISSQMRIALEIKDDDISRFRLELSFSSEGCGGLYQGHTGSVRSPNYPSSYPHNVECQWEIKTEPGLSIRLRFQPPFDLEAADCQYDYVEIFDYSAIGTMISLGRYCHNVEPPVKISSSHRMGIVFRSDQSTNGNGFLATWDSECGGGIFQQLKGVIQSPGFPRTYLNNLNCHYSIQLGPNHFIAFQFRELTLFDGDSLIINGRRIQSRRQHYYYDHSPISPLRTFISRDHVNISFVTGQRNVTGRPTRGFHIPYQGVECGGVLNQSEGEVGVNLTSFIRGHWGARNRIQCTWDINVDENKIVVFRIQRLGFLPCHFFIPSFRNSLTIFDRSNSTNIELAKACGEHVLPHAVRTSGNRMVIKLNLDVLPYSYTGFKGYFSSTYGPRQGCGGTLRESSGVIRSLDIDGDGFYEDNMDCSWTLIGGVNEVFSLNITITSIEWSPHCDKDWLSIYDGPTISDAVLGKFCGSSTINHLLSTGNMMSLVFHTNSNINRQGFTIDFQRIPVACGGIYSVTTSPQVISYNSSSTNSTMNNLHVCTWTLDSGSPGNLILVNITSIDICNDQHHTQQRRSCQFNYLTVRDWPQTIYSGWNRYCGSTPPHPFYSKGQIIRIDYHHTEFDSQAFQLTYQLAGCNREYLDSSGRVINHDILEHYHTSVDCMLTISAPPNTFLSLYFGEFIVPSHNNSLCYSDYLQVRNSSDNVLTSLCGSYLPNPIYLPDNKATLQLVSDSLSIELIKYDITYIASRTGPGCGGTITDLQTGVLTSPGYPVTSPVNQTCTWTITPPLQTRLSFKLTLINVPNLGGQSRDCNNNYMSVQIPRQGDTPELSHTYCWDPRNTESDSDDTEWWNEETTTITYVNSGSAPVFQIVFKPFS